MKDLISIEEFKEREDGIPTELPLPCSESPRSQRWWYEVLQILFAIAITCGVSYAIIDSENKRLAQCQGTNAIRMEITAVLSESFEERSRRGMPVDPAVSQSQLDRFTPINCKDPRKPATISTQGMKP